MPVCVSFNKKGMSVNMNSFSIQDQKVDEVMNIIEKVCLYDISQVPESMRAGVQDVLLYTLNQYVKKIWDEEGEYELVTMPTTNANTNEPALYDDVPLSETTMTETNTKTNEELALNNNNNDTPSSETVATTTTTTKTSPFYVGDTFSISEFVLRATIGHQQIGFRDRLAREMSRLYLLEKDAPVVKQKRNVVCTEYRYPVTYKHLAMAAYDTVVNAMAREELTSFSEKK